VEQSHHAVRVIDNVVFPIVRCEGHRPVRSLRDLVPLHYKIVNDKFAGAW